MEVEDGGSLPPARLTKPAKPTYCSKRVNKPLTIFITTLVLIANTICVCMESMASIAPSDTNGDARLASSHRVPQPRHEGCKGHPERDKPAEGDRDPGTCGHCTGTVSAEAPQGKSVVSVPAVVSVIDPILLADFLAVQRLRSVPMELLAMPPPIEPPTLLNLACSLTT